VQESGAQHLAVVDLSKEQLEPPLFDPPHHRILRGKRPELDRVERRKPNQIDGVVIHQTGCSFGVTAAQMKASGGNRNLAKHRRALGVAAHMTAFNTGFAVLAHPLDWYVFHANSLNARSLGIEIEGLFPELIGDKELLNGPLLQAAKDGLSYLVQSGREQKMPIRWVWAHRQSSLTRPADPGEEIWRKLVLDFAVPTLGLVPQPDFITGGKALPAEWRPAKSGGR
jgi:N-acetylmuramoyl-L-alanine amidase